MSLVYNVLQELIVLRFDKIYPIFLIIQLIPFKIIRLDGNGGPGSGSLIIDMPKAFFRKLTKNKMTILCKAKKSSKVTSLIIKVFFTNSMLPSVE